MANTFAKIVKFAAKQTKKPKTTRRQKARKNVQGQKLQPRGPQPGRPETPVAQNIDTGTPLAEYWRRTAGGPLLEGGPSGVSLGSPDSLVPGLAFCN